MNRQSYLKRVLWTVVLGTATTVFAGATDVCTQTSQDGLSSCKVAGQSTYWQTLGMCANLGDATARQTCQDKAQTAYHFSVDFCQAQFKSRQECAREQTAVPTIR